jgi:hypothetical protein
MRKALLTCALKLKRRLKFNSAHSKNWFLNFFYINFKHVWNYLFFLYNAKYCGFLKCEAV